MHAHVATALVIFVAALSPGTSQSPAASDGLQGSCPADSLVLQGKCSSHFEVQAGIFNASWFEDMDTVDRISEALQSGRVVVIRNAVSHMVASEMREELRSLGRKAFELKESHNHAEITMPDRSIWRGSGVEVCQSISGHFHKFTTQSSTKVCSRQHHLTNLSKEESPRLRSFTEFMKSDAVQMFLSTLAGACDPPDDCNLSQLPKVPNAKIGEVSHDLFWQHTGDYMSTNRGSKPGRLLSATYHLSDDKFRGSKHGGNLIWCTPFQRISPDFNTLVLFRVSRQSWHALQPVVNKSPSSRGISIWYKMPGGEDVLKADKFAQDWDIKDFSDTMSPVELGAKIRPKQ
mmetsp:Transcript_160270/g.284006  ORF Transcript_160270/g.284006 Transcript_160270/m.284006 type:complete len:346 (-) Transcript_160270:138-1175(-)